MRKILLIVILTLVACEGFCQERITDSLIHELSMAKTDSSRLNILMYLLDRYNESKPESVLYYAPSALKLARQLGDKRNEAQVFFELSLSYATLGNTTKAVEMDLKGLDIATQINHILLQANFYNRLGKYYKEAKDYEQSLQYSRKSVTLYESEGEKFQALASMSLNQIGDIYLETGQLDSAQYYNSQALIKWNEFKRKYASDSTFNTVQFIQAEIHYSRAGIQSQKGNYTAAILDLKESLKHPFYDAIIKANCELARVFLKIHQFDSAILYAIQSLSLAEKIKNYNGTAEAGNLLAAIYKNNPQKVIFYQQKVIAANDSASTRTNVNAIKNLVDFDEQQRQFEIEAATAAYQNKVRQYALFSGVGVLLLIAFILYRSNSQKQKSNKVLQTTLINLQSTQSQLIQSEKMASLGELTAGIAHEIQNPLNFVNNFSEVNTELIEELKSEKLKVKNERDEQLENELLTDIAENEKKINHHGKRADAIVKGMLQHSQVSTGQKEPTDINKLADEYMRLSYHGLRAKVNSFNVTMKTDFDETIGNVNIVPQDIGRVLLNLYNNAFYAVNEKQKAEGLKLKAGGKEYEPTISVSTKKIGSNFEISVTDNGNGIPQKIVDKIFQPFFTTKPTGQGTGLGLSLAYDIIKAHGGEIKVETKEGEGTEFIIQLPIV